MVALIQNRYTRFEQLTAESKAQLSELFAFQPPGYYFTPAYRAGHWDGKIRMMRGVSVPTGLYLMLRKEIPEETGDSVDELDLRKAPKFKPLVLPSGYQKRDYQLDAVDRMQQFSMTGGIVLNATGTGKTMMCGLYLRTLVGRAVFIVDERTLLNQAHDELASVLGEPVGRIGDGYIDLKTRVTVATVQGLHQKLERLRSWGQQQAVAIIDELHTMLNARQREVITEFGFPCVFGVTGTLDRTKAHKLYPAVAMCGPIIHKYDYVQARKEGTLAKGAIVCVDVVSNFDLRTDLPENYSRTGDLKSLYRTDVVHSKIWNRAIVNLTTEAVKRGYPTIVLVDWRSHVELLSRKFRKAGISHGVAHGLVKGAERRKVQERFENGKVKVIIANRVFAKGINLTNAMVVIDGACLRGMETTLQKFGRGTRRKDGKVGMFYFDLGWRGRANPLASVTNGRRRALLALKVPMVLTRAKLGAADAFNLAEKALTTGRFTRPSWL